jgi:hypothetical protein
MVGHASGRRGRHAFRRIPEPDGRHAFRRWVPSRDGRHVLRRRVLRRDGRDTFRRWSWRWTPVTDRACHAGCLSSFVRSAWEATAGCSASEPFAKINTQSVEEERSHAERRNEDRIGRRLVSAWESWFDRITGVCRRSPRPGPPFASGGKNFDMVLTSQTDCLRVSLRHVVLEAGLA